MNCDECGKKLARVCVMLIADIDDKHLDKIGFSMTSVTFCSMECYLKFLVRITDISFPIEGGKP